MKFSSKPAQTSLKIIQSRRSVNRPRGIPPAFLGAIFVIVHAPQAAPLRFPDWQFRRRIRTTAGLERELRAKIARMADGELIFVYNADHTFGAQVLDFVHKAVAPETYACNLCRVTFGTFGMKKEWKEFIQMLPHRSDFLHRDQFLARYPELAATALPAVFFKGEDGRLRLIVSAEEIQKPRAVEEMKELLSRKLGLSR